MSDSTELAILLAERAVHRLIALYSRHADALDGDALASLFAPDGRLTAGKTVLDGGDAIRSWIASMGSARSGHHVVSNVLADCTAESASATADMLFIRHVPGETPAIIVAGRYEDSFVRTPAGWVFASRKISFG